MSCVSPPRYRRILAAIIANRTSTNPLGINALSRKCQCSISTLYRVGEIAGESVSAKEIAPSSGVLYRTKNNATGNTYCRIPLTILRRAQMDSAKTVRYTARAGRITITLGD